MFQSGQLHFSAGRHKMELWSPVEAEWLSSEAPECPRAELTELSLSRMSFDDWGDRVLSAAEGLQKWTWRATCQQCRQEGRFVWRAPRGRRGGGSTYYCAECWHGHCGSAHWVCESLHEMKEWDEWMRTPTSPELVEEADAEEADAELVEMTRSPDPELVEEAEAEPASSEQSWFALAPE
ncbi:unnamed protein product [Prorocentrum cordatum]|uniref:Uncharacterized protein n=1 Tax=Prorocentrum cordatum TaxID=2364126 RepID=A0ABN9XJW3_9DINO|nr:unnamed protein product [Polarella glacialis]